MQGATIKIIIMFFYIKARTQESDIRNKQTNKKTNKKKTKPTAN